MPLLSIDRTQITRARATHVKQRDAQRDARAKLQAAQAELGTLRAQGADERTLARLQARIDSLAAAAREQVATGREQLQSIRSLSDRLVAAQRDDPARLVQALDAQHPVLLLPVSIQTRYDDATTFTFTLTITNGSGASTQSTSPRSTVNLKRVRWKSLPQRV